MNLKVIKFHNKRVAEFQDVALADQIRRVLRKTREEAIYKDEIVNIKALILIQKGIRSLEGLQYCSNLEELYLNYNYIEDLSPLQGLLKLKLINLTGNRVKDLQPVLRNIQAGGIPMGSILFLGDNELTLSNMGQLMDIANSGIYIKLRNMNFNEEIKKLRRN